MSIQCMAQQASILSHSSNVFYNPWATELAELLINLTKREGGLGFGQGSPQADGGAKVFFANSGTEANEGALKIARKLGKDNWARKHNKSPEDPSCSKYRVVYFKNSFHGRSLGSLSATGTKKYQIPFAPLVPGFDMGKVNDIDSVDLVGDDTCAVIVEPIQGEGGIFPAQESWLRELRKRCSEKGAVLIFDEIQVSDSDFGYLYGTQIFYSVDCIARVIFGLIHLYQLTAIRILSQWRSHLLMVSQLVQL